MIEPGYVDPYYANHPSLEMIQDWLEKRFAEISNTSVFDFAILRAPDFSDDKLITVDSLYTEPLQKPIEPKFTILTRQEFWDRKNNPQHYFFCAKDGEGRWVCSNKISPFPKVADPVDAYLNLCEQLDITPTVDPQ